MTNKKRSAVRMSYKRQKTVMKAACVFLLTAACLTIGSVIALFNEARQIFSSETNQYISELAQSVGDAVEQRFQRTLRTLESVALSYNRGDALSAAELEEMQKRAELLQFEYFAFVSPDGSAICSDGVPRTFTQQDGAMKAFEGQPIIEVKPPETAAYEENKNMPFFAVPIYAQGGTGEIFAVLLAHAAPQWADFFLTQYYYGGDVFFNVIKSDGTKVFMTDSPYVSPLGEHQSFDDRNNIFDTLEANAEIIGDTTIADMKNAAAAGGSEKISFRFPQDNLMRTAQLVPIGDTDLCVWMVEVNDAVGGMLDRLLHQGFLVSSLIILCFSALVIVLLLLYRRSTYLLMVDPVTGGYSLPRFEQEAEDLIRNSSEGSYTFVSVNIANFKVLNDTYGYDESNRILKHIHDTVCKYMEPGEVFARIGADDFNMLLHTIPTERFLQEMGLIAEEVNQFNNGLSEKQWLMFRVGVYQIMDTSLPIVYIRDRANIARKKARGDIMQVLYSCSFYEEEDRARLLQENTIKNKMRDALKNHDFKVYLQPKIDISTGKVSGAEALVRWQDKDMGLVPPDTFIPLFERIGFIQQLDLYMFEQVCIQLRRWLDAGLQPVPVSVNLSRTHLGNKDFLNPFVEIQKKHDVPPELLELELTETAFQDYPDEIPEAIRQIHNAGYTCSLDDFGSGYSSLNNLETLDIDVLKLDRKFLRSARTKDDKGHIVIEELVRMANRLGITVCCEGVETETQLAFLQECRCDKGQGYFFSKPVEVAAFERLVYGTSL